MKQVFLIFFTGILIILVSCTSQENLIATEYEILNQPESTLIHTELFSTSSATGRCVGQASDRWYGTSEKPDKLIGDFEKHLSDNDWDTWPEDVTPIWRKEDDTGFFTFSLFVYPNTEQIEPNRAYYNLSDSILHEMDEYQTVYVITLSHMFSGDANRCFNNAD